MKIEVKFQFKSLSSSERMDSPQNDSQDDAMPRIAGGAMAVAEDYPWMVLVNGRGAGVSTNCGGTIINESWILTAAHCITYPYKPWRYEIYVGLQRLSKKSDKRVKKHKISKIIVHKDFNDTGSMNDIALMQTKHNIDIQGSNGYVNSIALPNTMKDPTGWATVSGWGCTVEGGNKSDILKAVQVPLVSRDKCQEVFKSEFTESDICAGNNYRGKCKGDSGGPLVQKNKEGNYTLIGIVSRGFKCGSPQPGIYTKVAYYLNWINENMD